MSLFARLRFALPLAVAIALAAGLVPSLGYPLSLSRTLVFFPLFLFGHRLDGQRLRQLGDSVGRKGMALAVLMAAALGAWLLRDYDSQWLCASVGYAVLDMVAWPGMGICLALLTASASCCALAVLAPVPRRASQRGLGHHFLTANLMHGFLVRAMVVAGVFARVSRALPGPAEPGTCLLAGALIAGLRSTRVAASCAAPLTQSFACMRTAARRAPHPIRRRMEEFKRLY